MGTLPPDRRIEVLKHELIHAYTTRFIRFRSRFIDEGLAEYLRYVEPRDRGLGAPPWRMRHNLAALKERLDALQAAGVDVSAIKPARLVTLTGPCISPVGRCFSSRASRIAISCELFPWKTRTYAGDPA